MKLLKQTGMVSSIEYTLMAAVILGVSIATLNDFGDSLATAFDSVLDNFSLQITAIGHDVDGATDYVDGDTT